MILYTLSLNYTIDAQNDCKLRGDIFPNKNSQHISAHFIILTS